jgi:hypothetical protein
MEWCHVEVGGVVGGGRCTARGVDDWAMHGDMGSVFEPESCIRVSISFA